MAKRLARLVRRGLDTWSANLLNAVSDVYPSSAVGSVIGIGQSLASVGGLVFSSLLPGFLISLFGYTPVSLMLGTFHLAGFASVHWLMGDLRPIGKHLANRSFV